MSPSLRGPRLVSVLLLLARPISPAASEAAPPPLVELRRPPPEASGRSGSIDPDAATRAYLDTLSAGEKARSDAYFEGGYWLQLWGYLWSVGAFLLLLASGTSARMRDRAERLTRFKLLQAAAYSAQFIVAVTVLSFPLTFYQDYLREHRYGLSNLTLGSWLGEQAKGLLLAVVLGSLGLALLYAVVRRAPRSWWLWGSVTATALVAFVTLITPVLIVPVFNTQKHLADERVRTPILSMARANGIHASEVWEVDASKQSNRMSANVAGLLGTERITLNDNLLKRGSLPEIEAVMAHEMGHYVLNHAYQGLLEFGILFVCGFALMAVLFERIRRRYEGAWRIRDVADPAGLPLLALLFSTYAFVATPVLNSLIRWQEVEADIFGLNASGQPDGFAQAALHLSEYRKMEPGPIEEMVFYDHPSGKTRIHAAMGWKAEHRETWGAPAREPGSKPGD